MRLLLVRHGDPDYVHDCLTEKGKREAMIAAVDEGFATVITSGSILTMAGFMIGFRVSDVYVSHIGLAVGRGAAVSVLLVMTVLPQFILLLDRLIDKTSFTLRLPTADEEETEKSAAENAASEEEGKEDQA